MYSNNAAQFVINPVDAELHPHGMTPILQKKNIKSLCMHKTS